MTLRIAILSTLCLSLCYAAESFFINGAKIEHVKNARSGITGARRVVGLLLPTVSSSPTPIFSKTAKTTRWL